MPTSAGKSEEGAPVAEVGLGDLLRRLAQGRVGHEVDDPPLLLVVERVRGLEFDGTGPDAPNIDLLKQIRTEVGAES